MVPIKLNAMNIRDRKIYPTLIILLGLMGTLTSCHRYEPIADEHVQTDIPILLAPDSEWPDMVKVSGPIDEVGDLSDDGIVVWGRLNSDTEVFGQNGTKAKYPDWDYSPKKYWTVGSYTFASVLPASSFKTSDSDNGYTCTWNNDFTKASFSPPFNLKEDQIDLMTAFAAEEFTLDHINEVEEIQAVKLAFEHRLSLLNFTIKETLGTSIEVNSVKLYGNHAVASSITNEGSWILSEKTTSSAPFYTNSNKLTLSPTDTQLISGLLVFPESSGDLYVEVKYTETLSESTNVTTRRAKIPMEWLSGQSYSYKLEITPSSLVVIKKNGPGEWNIITDITHTFE